MNPDNTNNIGQQGTQDDPESQKKPEEKIIQPLNTQENLKQQSNVSRFNPKIDSDSIYPEAMAQIPSQDYNPSQKFALKAMEDKTKDSDRLVCTRVKSLMVAGVLYSLAGIYTIVQGLGISNNESLSWIIAGLGLAQTSMALALLITKDHHTASLILKIFLIFLIINLLLNLANPYSLTIGGFLLIFLFYVYFRVKSLSYY